MKKLMLASVCAGCLMSTPAHAISWEDSITEVWDDVPSWVLQLVAIIEQYAAFQNSYLFPIPNDFEIFFPEDGKDLVTIGDNKAYVDDRLEDVKRRAGEVMGVSREVAWQQPMNQARMTALESANVSPLSLFAAVQIGNEVGLETANAANKTNSLLAELNQMVVDSAMKEDFQSIASKDWAEYHFPNGIGADFNPPPMGTYELTW